MEEFLTNLPAWVKMIPAIFLGLVLVATVVVRFTKTEKDDAVVGKIGGYIKWFLHRFPTFGLNPSTKKLMDALEALKGKSEEKADDTESPASDS